MIKNDLNVLNTTDIYSSMLFVLFKIKDIPEYSSLSELAYVLDKENMLNLCEYFGGQTIKIPTVEELQSLIYSMLLYQYVKIEKIEYDKAIKMIGYESKDLRKIKSDYIKLCEVLENYEFKSR